MFLDVPSCSLMFLHVPSCSFMFLHVPSCSLSLLGAQNLIFFGLNFVTISVVKNQFLGPSRVVIL